MSYFKETIQFGGSFKEKEFGKYFEFRPTSNPWAMSQGLEFEIALTNGEIRFAKILKTVAYVAIDEDVDGSAILQKWTIKKQWERKKAQD